MRRALICAFAALLTGCAAQRVAVDHQRDSVAVIVRDSVIFRDSVVMVEIPKEADKDVVMQTGERGVGSGRKAAPHTEE